HDQQVGGGEGLADARRRAQAEERTQHEPSDQQDGEDGGHALEQRQAQRGGNAAAAARRQQRQQRQQRHDREILEQQNRERDAADPARQLAALGEELQHRRGRGEGQRAADDQRRGRREAKPVPA